MPIDWKSMGAALRQRQPVVMRTSRSQSHDADVFMKRGDAQAVLDIMQKSGMIKIQYYEDSEVRRGLRAIQQEQLRRTNSTGSRSSSSRARERAAVARDLAEAGTAR